MKLKINQSGADKVIYTCTVITLVFMIVLGLVMCVWQLKPFLLDEWAIIYNLKFKNNLELWGKLDCLQQFPRVYLHLIKWFTEPYNYSYTSLRLPSYIVHSTGLIFCLYLAGRIWKSARVPAMLWFLIFANFNTSIAYYVQIKQYTMEMLLGLVSVWLLLQLCKIQAGGQGSVGKFIFICLVAVTAPFFSYTYPITLAPLYLVLGMQYLSGYRYGRRTFPLWTVVSAVLSLVSVVVFYVIDVQQVMHDQGMKKYWAGLINANGFNLQSFAYNFYMLFAGLGTGDLFQVLFFVLGITAFVWYATGIIKNKGRLPDAKEVLMAYSILLIALCIALNLAGKLPIGTHRFTAFMVPAMAVIIVYLLADVAAAKWRVGKYAGQGITYLLIAVSAINIYAAMLTDITGSETAKRRVIYRVMENGINQATEKHLAICADSSVGFPYDKVTEADWIIKAQPAYDVQLNIPVYIKGRCADSVCSSALLITAKDLIRDMK